LSRSATSWLILSALVFLVPVAFLLRERRFTPGVRLLFASLLVVAAIGIASQGAGLALELLGRDFSFTGRTTLWRAVWDVVETRFPVLGAGYGAFFTPSGAVPDLAPHLTHWGGVPNHAHSGFLDTLANLGWPGVAILGLLMLSSLCRVLDILLRRQASRVWIGVLAFQVLFLINNFSESSAFRHADPIWILFLVMACQTAPGLNVRSRPRAPLPRLRAARLTPEAA
jgi:O-antigen ligase